MPFARNAKLVWLAQSAVRETMFCLITLFSIDSVFRDDNERY